MKGFWYGHKNLLQLTTNVIVRKRLELIPILEEELKINRNLFANILDNAGKSKLDRDRIMKGHIEGIELDGRKGKHLISYSLIEEAIILSDLYNMNEFEAVALLLEAESQMQYFPGLTRGLTAILLYYDSKKSIVNTLNTLLLARIGRTWILDETMPKEFIKFLADFTNKLIEERLIQKILKQIEAFNWNLEQEKLLREGGLGNAKHRKQVKTVFDEVRTGLCECIFSSSCQVPLELDDTMAIMNYLKDKCELNAKSQLDFDNIYLVMSVLYCFDHNCLENKQQSDVTNLLSKYSNFKPNYLKTVNEELLKNDYGNWKAPGIKAIFQFSWAIYLSALYPYLNDSIVTSKDHENIFGDDDDTLIDRSIEQRVFKFLNVSLISNDKFHKEKYFVERVHNLIVDFIYKMPAKIKDLRNRNEDIVKLASMEENLSMGGSLAHQYFSQFAAHNPAHHYSQAGANFYKDFEDLLNLIGDFYSKDPLGLQLSLNYWSADSDTSGNLNMSSVYKPSQKQISLYKFVRYFLSGDALAGTLYMAYIHMLTGLCTGEESAQHCFVLLQHSGHFYDAQNPNISWNHIFFAFERYYDSLRADIMQKQQAANAFQMSATPTPAMIRSMKGITQQELHALTLVVRLINQIAFYSEKSRIALCEFQRGADSTLNAPNMFLSHHQALSLPVLMFGLLTCPIPVNLKGDVLTLLASLSLTPNIATNMWQALENSQIVSTIPSVISKSGIEVELDDIETREETYPMLIGFLKLIKNLIKVPVPENLGAGFRTKGVVLGFQPYLQFLVENVYLKYATRPYKNQSEKWQIASLILSIFYQLIENYEISMNDFKYGASSAVQSASSNAFISESLIDDTHFIQSKSPGYRLFFEFLHDGHIVRILFRILSETLQYLHEYNPEADKNIETSGLYALKIAYTILNKQKSFIDCMRNANMNTTNTGLEKLLLCVDSRTNKVDRLMYMFRFMQFSSDLVKHAFYSINILLELSNYLNLNSQILNFFVGSVSSPREQSDIIHGFVEAIEFDDEDKILDQNEVFDEEVDLEADKARYRSLTRWKVLKFILFNLKFIQSPNIAHLLLGFDIRNHLSKTEFHLPGTNISKKDTIQQRQSPADALQIVSRNCLHSVIDTLNSLTKDSGLLLTLQSTIDISYEILYTLCTNKLFSSQILHFLRHEYDFVFNHLKQVPFQLPYSNPQVFMGNTSKFIGGGTSTISTANLTHDASEVSSVIDSELDDTVIAKNKCLQTVSKTTSYILYSANSWVLYLTCSELQNLLNNRMITQASKLINLLIEAVSDEDDMSLYHTLNKPSGIFNVENRTVLQEHEFDGASKIFKLLSIVELVEEPPKSLHLNYFDVGLTEKVINACKYKSDLAGITYGIQLYDLKQIQTILMNEISSDTNIASSKLNIIHEIKNILNNIVERNQFQLKFISKKRYLDSFKTLVECLILLTPNKIFNLQTRYKLIVGIMRQLFKLLFVEEVIIELTYPIASFLFVLMCNLKNVINESYKQSSVVNANQSQSVIDIPRQRTLFNPSNLYEILSNTIEYLLNSSLSNYKVRTYLYGVISNYLMIFKNLNLQYEEKQPSPTKRFGLNIQSTQIDLSDSYMILCSKSDLLLKYVCTDACEGTNITTMMALSLLNNLLNWDRQSLWLKYINDNGYLGCLINSMQKDNHLLEECFHSNSDNNKIIFLFESKLSLLISMAKTSQGSRYLLNNNLITVLSMASVFNLRTKFDRNIYETHVPIQIIQLLHQFHQILFPTINLCISIIDSLGLDNIEAKSQVARFLLSHSDTILHILSSKIGDVQMLEELKLVTSLLCKLAPFDELNFDKLPSNLTVEYKASLSRIQKELIQLICVYFVPEQLKVLRNEIILKSNQDDVTSIEKSVRLFCVQIASNICSYCSTMMKGSDLRMSLLIFSPKLRDNIASYPTSGLMGARISTKHIQFILLIDFLKYSLSNLEKSIELELDLQSKKDRLNDLIEIEIKQIVGDYKRFQKLSLHEKQYYLREQLNNFIKMSKDEIKTYIHILEKSLLLLWRHVEFYLAYYEPMSRGGKATNKYFSNLTDAQSPLGKSQAQDQLSIEGLTKDDLAIFRQDLPLFLTPSFFKKFLDIEEKYIQPKTNSVFINVLIKRMQRLLHLNS